MSVCPHPRPPVERCVGEACELVCPDCHERMSSTELTADEIAELAEEPAAPAPRRKRSAG